MTIWISYILLGRDLGPVNSKEQQALLDELTQLSKTQSAALQQAAYFRMTKNEADEYDARAKRIGELCALTKD